MNEYEKLELRGRTDEPRISLDEAWEFRTSVLTLADTAPLTMKNGRRIISLNDDPFAIKPEEGRHLRGGYILSVVLSDESSDPGVWRSSVLFREGMTTKDGSLDRSRIAQYEIDVEDEEVTRAMRTVSIARNAVKVETDIFGKKKLEIIDSQERSFELQITSGDVGYVVSALQRADKLPRRRKAA